MNTLKQGDKVPNFTVNDQSGNPVSLTDYKGKKLIVFFYPKASTPGCTAEACNLTDNYKTLQDKGYEILGVSADSEKRQTNFKEKYKLPFLLQIKVLYNQEKLLLTFLFAQLLKPKH